MKSSSLTPGRFTSVLGIMVVASLLAGPLSSRATAASPEVPTSAQQGVPTAATAKPSPEESARVASSQAEKGVLQGRVSEQRVAAGSVRDPAAASARTGDRAAT
jgi:hypothetical protein